MGYCTLAQVKARLEVGAGTEWDSTITDAIEWAQDFIDDYCDRTFEAAAGTHYFTRAARDPYNARRLILDGELTSIASLKNGDSAATAITSDQYWLEPRNEAAKTAILLKSDYAWEFDTDYEVSVAGSWGSMTSADGVIESCALRLAEWAYRSKDLIEATTPFSQSIVTKPPADFPSEVLMALDPKRRLR